MNEIVWKSVNQLRNKVATSDDNPFDRCNLEGDLPETVIFWKRLGIQASHVETINASDFKARCFAILDRVQATGEGVVILKRGRPVAELLPASQTCAEYAQFELKGTVIEVGDIVKPAVPEEHWDGLRS